VVAPSALDATQPEEAYAAAEDSAAELQARSLAVLPSADSLLDDLGELQLAADQFVVAAQAGDCLVRHDWVQDDLVQDDCSLAEVWLPGDCRVVRMVDRFARAAVPGDYLGSPRVAAGSARDDCSAGVAFPGGHPAEQKAADHFSQAALPDCLAPENLAADDSAPADLTPDDCSEPYCSADSCPDVRLPEEHLADWRVGSPAHSKAGRHERRSESQAFPEALVSP